MLYMICLHPAPGAKTAHCNPDRHGGTVSPVGGKGNPAPRNPGPGHGQKRCRSENVSIYDNHQICQLCISACEE